MKLVLQKRSTDCGVASLAMISGANYDEALAAVFPNRKPHTSYATTLENIAEGFARLGLAVSCDIPFLTGDKTSLTQIKRNALIILDLGDFEYHAVVWCPWKKAIYDPLIDDILLVDKDRVKVSNRKYSISARKFFETKIFAYFTVKR